MNAANNNNNETADATVLLDIVIPKVSKYTSPRYIAKVFYENKIAMVRHVKFIQYKFTCGEIFKRAIIQLACWFNSPAAQNIQRKIQTQSFARTIHKDENAWTLQAATEDDKNLNVEECAFFKIQNVAKYGYYFKGEVQENEKVVPVFVRDIHSNIQYVYYREPKLEGGTTNWENKTPNDIIDYFSRMCEVLETEDVKIIEGLKYYMTKNQSKSKSTVYSVASQKHFTPKIVRYQ